MGKNEKKVRSFEVAELAKISRSTVSRALSGDPRISEDTRARVHAAAAKLGYQPNMIARGLKNQTTGIVGVVVTNLDNAYHAHALQLLIEKLGERKLAPLVFVGHTARGAESAIDRLMSYQVDAVIALAAPFSEEIVSACSAGKVPLVLMNKYDGEQDVSFVCGDSMLAGRMAADHLIEGGATSFGYFAGEDTTSISRDREAGFVQRLQQRGFALSARTSSRYSHEQALIAARSLLNGEADGIFCANDTLAFALLDARRTERSEKCPLILGYDNSALAAWPSYDLSSIDQNLEKMTTVTVDIVRGMIVGGTRQTFQQVIEPYLVERGSTLAKCRT